MSKYQYYEFQAIDRPLSEKEQAEVSSYSSRAEITSHHAVFTYNYSDFPGDSIKLLQKYFDAMLYLNNWGTKQLVFRLPRSLVDADLIAVAAEASGENKEAVAFDVEQQIAKLSKQERIAFLVKVARGDHQVNVQFLKRLQELAPKQRKRSTLSPTPRRKAAELLTSAAVRFDRRKELERQKADKARIKRFNEMAPQEPEMWKKVFDLIKTKQTKAYDEAVKLLTELRDLAQHLGRLEEFESRLGQIQQKFSSLSGLKSLLQQAELIKGK
jgi:hypothetical protein